MSTSIPDRAAEIPQSAAPAMIQHHDLVQTSADTQVRKEARSQRRKSGHRRRKVVGVTLLALAAAGGSAVFALAVIPHNDNDHNDNDHHDLVETSADTEVRKEARPQRRRSGRRRRKVVGVTLLALAAAGGVVTVTQPFSADAAAPAPGVDPSNLATVREGALAAQVNQSGTLSYAAQSDGSPYTAVNHIDGIYTSVPTIGQAIACGDVIYTVGDTSVPLLCGDRPFYRDLSYGNEGWDVVTLNKNLVELGYATSSEIDPASDFFGGATESALKELQEKIGAEETGRLRLGHAVALPGPLRVGTVVAKLGTRGAPGTPVIEATSSGRQVTVALNASQQSQVEVGDVVLITLPNLETTPGKVSRIGAVVSSAGEDSQSPGTPGAASSTVPIYITLDRPEDAGTLDEAPVQVGITTDGVDQALIVPVTALAGKAGGGYVVERVDAQGTRTAVPVTLGLFDNANGLVQVTGELAAGDRVVVPST